MKLNLLQEVLVQSIQRFGSMARDYRQVQKRLEQLLPDRLQQLSRHKRSPGLSVADATRSALVSEEYQTYLNEIVEVGAQSFESRIQYETHMMLFEARRSLRRLKRF